MPRTVLDLELEKLRFELVLQGYTSSDMAKLRTYLCDLRHVMMGLATISISPRSLPCSTVKSSWLPMSVLSYQDIKLLAIYARNPEATTDSDFIKEILSCNEAVEILEAMMDLYSAKKWAAQVLKDTITPMTADELKSAHKEQSLGEARAFLNFFKGSLPDVMYYEY